MSCDCAVDVCPEVVPLTQSTVNLSLFDGDGEYGCEHFAPAAGGNTVQLANIPISGWAPLVHLNGLLQPTTAFTVSATGLVTLVGYTFVAGDTVDVHFAWET